MLDTTDRQTEIMTMPGCRHAYATVTVVWPIERPSSCSDCVITLDLSRFYDAAVGEMNRYCRWRPWHQFITAQSDIINFYMVVSLAISCPQ